MKDFLKKILRGSSLKVPENCQRVFDENFQSAVNIEWFKKEDHYEAVFYIDAIEYISIFSFEAELIEYKTFLPPDHVPGHVLAILQNEGELMNTVLINKGNTIQYEGIVRDSNKKRKLVLLNEHGKLIAENNL